MKSNTILISVTVFVFSMFSSFSYAASAVETPKSVEKTDLEQEADKFRSEAYMPYLCAIDAFSNFAIDAFAPGSYPDTLGSYPDRSKTGVHSVENAKKRLHKDHQKLEAARKTYLEQFKAFEDRVKATTASGKAIPSALQSQLAQFREIEEKTYKEVSNKQSWVDGIKYVNTTPPPPVGFYENNKTLVWVGTAVISALIVVGVVTAVKRNLKKSRQVVEL